MAGRGVHPRTPTTTRPLRVLVLNAGSSTLKASVLEANADDDRRVPDAEITVEWPAGEKGADDVVRRALDAVGSVAEAVGYRVVHGGPTYRSTTPVTDALISAVEELDELAPLHNRRAAAVMRAGLNLLPRVPHVACFDTAFHATLPDEAWRYALPAEWVERFGIRRYGFHGLSVAWSVRRAATLLGRDVSDLQLVVAHLGSGCSVTAVRGGRSVDTSMGFTPFEGLMMGTRAGSIDPGAILHLVAHGVKTDDLADGLARRSGLRAMGGTADVRELHHRADVGDQTASLALGMFARRAAAGIGAAATALDRLDAVVFTGGIGANAHALRRDIVRRLATIGLRAAEVAPGSSDAVLDAGPPAVIAILSREDAIIADEVAAAVRSHPS